MYVSKVAGYCFYKIKFRVLVKFHNISNTFEVMSYATGKVLKRLVNICAIKKMSMIILAVPN